MKNLVLPIAIVVFLMASCTPDQDSSSTSKRADSDKLETVEVSGIEKIHAVSDVFLAGQPDESGFKAAKEKGIKTVINLRHDSETEFNEREMVEELGLTYLHLPWNGEEELNDEIFDKTREMLKSAEKPILLHCKSANRVGAVWLPFRVLDEGVALDAAVDEAKTVGLKKTGYEDRARDYIKRKSS